MKIKRSRKSKKGRIEIIPMIDVMFFLLVTFMLASLAMQRVNGLAVNLPQGKADNIEVEEKITISINKDGVVYLENDQIALKEIYEVMKNKIAGNNDQVIVINSDKETSHGMVMSVMLEIKKAGAQHFSILTANE
ncbi:MAG: biopolymer transporter ExbD [Rickettsiales bacterium]|nr:biopolymer transporter ExbD [Rickettsiales bacterium]